MNPCRNTVGSQNDGVMGHFTHALGATIGCLLREVVKLKGGLSSRESGMCWNPLQSSAPSLHRHNQVGDSPMRFKMKVGETCSVKEAKL